MTKAKPNITPEDVLKTFYTLDGKSICLLTKYTPPAAEPEIFMREFGTENIIKGTLSQFKDYRRLQVEGELPKARKTRKDKGTKKGTSERAEQVSKSMGLSATSAATSKASGESTTNENLPDLTKIEFRTAVPPDNIYRLALDNKEAAGLTIRECLINFFAFYETDSLEGMREYIKNSPYFPEKTGFLGALKE